MKTQTFTSTQRWNGWFFSGFVAYVVQSIAWIILGFIFCLWEELWGTGLVQSREELVASGYTVANPVESIIGSTILYGMIGLTFAGLTHMVAYSIPGGLIWYFIQPHSLIIRHLWLTLLIGWSLGTTAMALLIYHDTSWFWTAAIVGGLYGMMTAFVCYVFIKWRIM